MLTLENKKAESYFQDWTSSETSQSSIQLLLSIYQQEDEKFGVKYSHGVLQELDFPLNPKLQIPPASSLFHNKSHSHLSISKQIIYKQEDRILN